MRAATFVSVLIISVAGFGCRPLSGPLSSQTTTFELLEKDFRIIPDTDARITFLGPVSDSRCPADVECITQGSASVEFRIDRPARQTVFMLEGYVGPDGVGEGDTRISALADGFLISLLRLDPYPIDSLVNNDLYRARIRVGR
ncbi:MAG: hypothetical protein HKN43_05480 [Rhodothermales bacterium]|nr:hypothetical protein [Rhodothermales bacterium]